MKVSNSRKQLQSYKCSELQRKTDKTYDSTVNTIFHYRTLSVFGLMCWEAQSLENEYLAPTTQKNGRNYFLHCPSSRRKDLSSWSSLVCERRVLNEKGYWRKIAFADTVRNLREQGMKSKKHTSNLTAYGKSSQFSYISMAKYFNQCSAQLFWAYI